MRVELTVKYEISFVDSRDLDLNNSATKINETLYPLLDKFSRVIANKVLDAGPIVDVWLTAVNTRYKDN